MKTMSNVVFGYAGEIGITPCVYEDHGAYPDTKPEYNTRKVGLIETFEAIGSAEATALIGLASDQSYGSRVGGGASNLYHITAEQLAILRSVNAERLACDAERVAIAAKRDESKKMSNNKQTQLKIYLSGDAVEADAQSALLKQAAKRARRSVSNFILTAALDAAEAMVRDKR
jgi:hypothetical protein